MTPAQKKFKELRERQSKERQKMAEFGLLEPGKVTDELRSEFDALEAGTPDLERQCRAAQTAVEAEEAAQVESRTETPDGEDRERNELRGKVRLHRYMEAALETRSADGAEAEYNAALKLPGNRFPLELLAPERRIEARTEQRATTAVDAAAMQGEWVDRLFADTAAARLGISMRSVSPGVATYPVTTAGASAAQRAKSETADDAAWTIGVTEIKPTRNAVRAVFNEEDAMRLPGLEDALRRDLGMALTEGIDRSIFIGDAGANGGTADVADIAGLTTATGVDEVTLTQAAKLLAPNTLALFAGMVDGKHAASMDDLRVVASVGANTLWLSTIAKAAADTKTLASFLRENGLSWGIRDEIDTATAAGDFGAFIGRGRGIDGAAVAAVWNSGMLIRDPYSGAAKGECALTLSYFWGFALPRPSNFLRLKFVA